MATATATNSPPVVFEKPARATLHPRKLACPLSEAQRAYYRQNGFVVLPGLFTAAEAQIFQREADRLYAEARQADPDNLRYERAKDGQTGEKVVWKIDPFSDISRIFLDMVRDRRICDALASLYDGYEPRLFKDKLIYKPAHTKGNALHQDYTWWQGFPTSLISVVVAIDGADEDNGCTELFPGYEAGLLTQEDTFDSLSEERVALDKGVKVRTQPGDVAMFSCFTPHRAGPNNTGQFRRQIFLTYNDSRDGEYYQSHYDHFFWYMTRSLSEEERERKFLR